jgi:ABC-2 type transport system permease protein
VRRVELSQVKQLKERYRYSIILLKQLVRTDFKLRYQGSVLGYAWSLLRPLLLFVILYVVFVNFLKFKDDTIPHYSIYLLLGIVLWNFFAETTSQSLSSIVSRGDIIRKIRIPRWTVVISSSLGALINLFFSLIVVALFMIINGADLTRTALLFPFVLLQLYMLALGLSLVLAALYVKYRDISYIWEVVLQGLFYLTPIIYPLSFITNLTFQKLLLINPIAAAVQNARYAVVSHNTITGPTIIQSTWVQLVPYAITLVFFITGILYFKKQAKDFAENL